jgi:hypothetical protein
MIRLKTIKVQEYFLFDPLGECLQPRLQGFRLRSGEYRCIRRVKGRPQQGRRPAPGAQRLGTAPLRSRRDRWLPTPYEDRDARLQEHEARLAAEAEVHRLQEELKRLRGEKS